MAMTRKDARRHSGLPIWVGCLALVALVAGLTIRKTLNPGRVIIRVQLTEHDSVEVRYHESAVLMPPIFGPAGERSSQLWVRLRRGWRSRLFKGPAWHGFVAGVQLRSLAIEGPNRPIEHAWIWLRLDENDFRAFSVNRVTGEVHQEWNEGPIGIDCPLARLEAAPFPPQPSPVWPDAGSGELLAEWSP